MNVLALIDQLRNCWFLNPNNLEINIGLFERDAGATYPVMRHPDLGEIYGCWEPVGLYRDVLEELWLDITRDIANKRYAARKTAYYYLIGETVHQSTRINPNTYEPYAQNMICRARFFK